MNSKNNWCLNQDFDIFFKTLYNFFNEYITSNTKKFIETLLSKEKLNRQYNSAEVLNLTKCNDRNYDKLKDLIWKSEYFKPYKSQEGGEIIDYYNTDSYTRRNQNYFDKKKQTKMKVNQNYFNKSLYR